MIASKKLYELAKSRYDESKILLKNKKLDGAVYLCGYAIELMLKKRIVDLLDWDGYPDSNAEFKEYKSFKVHDLDVLLALSGLEKTFQKNTIIFAKWQIARTWDPETRYKEVGKLLETEAQDIIDATRDILNFIVQLP